MVHGAKELIRKGVVSKVSIDTEIAAYLLNPGARDLDLESVLRRYIGVEFAEVQSDLFSEGWNPEAPAYMQELWKVLTAELEKHNALQLYQDLEIPTMHALAQMESVGIGVDQVALKKLYDFFEKEEKGSIAVAYQSVGHEFNVASPKQLQTVLFEELKLPKTKRIKTGFSTDAESLEWLYETTKHPVLEALLRVREVGKLRTTVEGLLSAIASDQRIHSTFQQTTTATGRLSSTDPNLQNIPVRTEE
ncbi:MAG: hypothetical protein RJB54_556, partial [Actinomycetota bacterium]